MLGRIAPEKGQLDFVRASRFLPHCQLEIFGAGLFSGEGYEGAVRKESAGLPVTFHGWQPPPVALAGMDILVVPSGPDEGAPRVIPEAFSAGVPVVAYPSGGIPEFIEHRRTGLLTESSSPESLAKSLLELVDDPAVRRRLAVAARTEWSSRFTLEAWRQRICDRIAAEASR